MMWQFDSLALGWLLLIVSLGLGWGIDSSHGCSLLSVSGWDNLGVSWEAELLDEVLDSGVGQEAVVPSPVVDLVKVSSGLEGLDDHHNVKVGNS